MSFPVAIITVNVVGSFLMGVFVVLAAQRGLTHLSPFVMTGLLGGFTTFSSFGFETYALADGGEPWRALGNVTLQVVLGLAAVWIGASLSRLG